MVVRHASPVSQPLHRPAAGAVSVEAPELHKKIEARIKVSNMSVACTDMIQFLFAKKLNSFPDACDDSTKRKGKLCATP